MAFVEPLDVQICPNIDWRPWTTEKWVASTKPPNWLFRFIGIHQHHFWRTEFHSPPSAAKLTGHVGWHGRHPWHRGHAPAAAAARTAATGTATAASAASAAWNVIVKMLLSTFHPKNWNTLEECTVNCNILHYHAKSWKHIQWFKQSQ